MMDIAGAEKKLRQAAFFLGHLEQASKELLRHDRNPEILEFYFSACLSAAQSVYYVLEETGGAAFRDVQKRWRGLLPESWRLRFGKMMGLRGSDVHLASTGAKSLPKYVKEDPTRYTFFFGHNAVVEVENPDGTKVSGSVFRGTLGLYIEQQGQRIEATEACREFIGQLKSLLEEMKTACYPREKNKGRAE
jgi:hypothetical protein